MLFQSAGFLFVFLPLFLATMALLPSGRPRAAGLLVFSYLFYSGAEPLFILLIVISSLTDFLVAIFLHAASGLRRKLTLCVSLTVNLGLLGFYKYGAWVIPKLTPFLAPLHIPLPDEYFFSGFILPAGISFYTFQSLSYTIDVYRGHVVPERNVVSFFNFVAYLPQLIAGPIERHGHLNPQLESFYARSITSNWSAGLDRIMLGIAQKLLVADSCGRIVDAMLERGYGYDFVDAWVIAIGFGMQIYYDFAAYTHIAIGISLILGIRLQENFDSPYQALSIQDFWRRWHMTLSRWFRDYVYIPLGGSRHGLARTAVNVMLTFLLVGLWHGAGWNFVAWGVIHGGLLALYNLKQAKLPRLVLPTALAVLVTFIAVHFAWVPFRVSEPLEIAAIWQAMLGLSGFGSVDASPVDIAILLLVLTATWLVPNASKRWPGAGGWAESTAYAGVALFTVFTTPEVAQFIYFQF